jgi:hypothetical protein
MGQKARAILSELFDRVTMIRLAAVSRTAAIEYYRPVVFGKKRYDTHVPGVTWPPGRWRQQDRFALPLAFIVDLYLA